MVVRFPLCLALIGGFEVSRFRSEKEYDVLATSESTSKFYMGVSKNRGTPKWMVYDGKPYLNG